MTFGTTENKPWIEAVPTDRGTFNGRTFSRFHIVGDSGSVPTVGEIWATSEHAVSSHAHDADELLYVLTGEIAVNGKTLGSNEVVFVPKGSSYSARVLSEDGARVLRIELSHAGGQREGSEYEARIWKGPLTEEGLPRLD